MCHADAHPATASGRLEHHWIANAAGGAQQFLVVQRVRGALDDRDGQAAGRFGQEAVAGVDGARPGPQRSLNETFAAQITLPRRGRADAVGLVGVAHVRSLPVGLGEDSDCLQPQFPAGAQHPHCDFPSVSDQDFANHPSSHRSKGRGARVQRGLLPLRLYLRSISQGEGLRIIFTNFPRM
jgi:hypothetical protein